MAAAHYAPSRSLSLPVTYISTPPTSPTSSSSSPSTSSLSPMTPPLSAFPSPPSALRKKDSLLSYQSQHSQEPSTSGASIRSTSTSKSFGTSLLEAYHEWKEADEAHQRLHIEERDRDEYTSDLAAAREMLGKLKADQYVDHSSITSVHFIDHCSVLPCRCHDAPRCLLSSCDSDASRSPGKRKVALKLPNFWKHKDPADLPFQDVPAPDITIAEVAAASVQVCELERETHRRNTQVREAVGKVWLVLCRAELTTPCIGGDNSAARSDA